MHCGFLSRYFETGVQSLTNVILFSHHARASAGSRAANSVSVSAVSNAARARSVANTDAHHSEGILLRWRHLGIIQTPAPMSAAMAACEGQMSMTSLNDVICDMPSKLGQPVLKSKAILSLDCGRSLGHNVRMAEQETESQFKQDFTRRVKAARAALGWKQWQMAEALGMPQDKYKQYEGRSLLPHHLIGRFCLLTRIDPDWLLTGRGQKPLQPLRIAPDESVEAVAKPKKTRAKRAA